MGAQSNIAELTDGILLDECLSNYVNQIFGQTGANIEKRRRLKGRMAARPLSVFEEQQMEV